MFDIIASLGVQDYIALGLVLLAAAAAVFYMIKRKKSGGGCSGCCGNCAMAGKCHKKEIDKNGTEDKLSDRTGENTENS